MMSGGDGFAEGMLVGSNGGYGNGGCNGMNGIDGIFGIIALLALANGGLFGGGYGGNGGAYDNQIQTGILEAAANQRQNCMEFTQTNSNITQSGYQTQNLVSNGFSQTARDICQLGTALTAVDNGNAKEIMQMLYGMQRDQDRCCCETQKLIQQWGCNIENMFKDNQISQMRDEISALRLKQEMNGVLRYPDGWTYNAGNNPFCGNSTRRC